MSDSPLWRPGRSRPHGTEKPGDPLSTNEHLSQPDGQLTTAWMDTLVELAENEVGLVITGHMSVDRSSAPTRARQYWMNRPIWAALRDCQTGPSSGRRIVPSSTTAEKKRRKT